MKTMNFMSIEEIDYPRFLKLGKLYQNKDDKKIYNVFPEITKVFKFDAGIPHWTLIDKKCFSEKGMIEIPPDKFKDAVEEHKTFFYEELYKQCKKV